MSVQTCRSCSNELPLDSFPRRRKGSEMRHTECTPCSVERFRQRRAKIRSGELVPRKHGDREPTGETKVCGRCETEKDRAEFDRDANKKDGRHTYCKTCRAEHNHHYIMGAGREHSLA